MSIPITMETRVGYIEVSDINVAYSEYYGDGTIYGLAVLFYPSGEPVKGAGKTKAELVAAGVLATEPATIPGDLVVLPDGESPAAPEVIPVEPYGIRVLYKGMTVVCRSKSAKTVNVTVNEADKSIELDIQE